MEALQMEPKANSWNDDRFDELSDRTEKGFDEVKGEFKVVRREIKDLREETKEEFKAVRREIQDLREETKGEFKAVRREIQELSEETKGEFKAVRREIKELSGRTDEIKGEMKDGFAQMPTRDEMNQRFAELNRSNNTLLIVGGTLFAAIIGTGILG